MRLEDLDVPLKIRRLDTWCKDIDKLQSQVKFDWIFVDEKSFKEYNPNNFSELASSFNRYKDSLNISSCPKCDSDNIMQIQFKFSENKNDFKTGNGKLDGLLAAEKPRIWYCRNCKHEW